MPPNWHYYQNMNHGTLQAEWPSGPLGLKPKHEPKWVDAWVIQSSTDYPEEEESSGPGASQSTYQRTNWHPRYAEWTAIGIPPGWSTRNFQTGPALGIALLASRDDKGAYEFDFWLDLIYLY